MKAHPGQHWQVTSKTKKGKYRLCLYTCVQMKTIEGNEIGISLDRMFSMGAEHFHTKNHSSMTEYLSQIKLYIRDESCL